MENTFKLKGIVMEDFVNYYKPSMFLSTCECDWKCCHEAGIPITICQNEPLARAIPKEYSFETLYNAYIKNDISKSIVIGGLEPMKQFAEVLGLIKYFRDNNCEDDFVIYTGYYPYELEPQLLELKKYKNIVIKFGRFKPNGQSHFDPVIGITLVNKEQYGERIS